MVDKPRKTVDNDVRGLVRDAILALREAYGRDRYGEPLSDRAWYDYLRVPRTTMRHLVEADAGASVDTLALIANRFGLDVWQLLVPGFDPRHPPTLPAVAPIPPKFSRRPKVRA